MRNGIGAVEVAHALWLVVTFLGIALAAYDWREAYVDLQFVAVRPPDDGLLRELVIRDIRMQRVHLAASVCLFSAGLIAWPVRSTTTTVWLLVAGVALFVANQTADAILRRRLMAVYVKRDNVGKRLP
jgi:hypothetical protein